jgi:hypothetical protein
MKWWEETSWSSLLKYRKSKPWRLSIDWETTVLEELVHWLHEKQSFSGPFIK